MPRCASSRSCFTPPRANGARGSCRSSGVAGIGKSRLGWEFHKYIDGVVEDIYWHQGRSPAYGEGITFWALGEMVRKRAGLAESDDAATTRERDRRDGGGVRSRRGGAPLDRARASLQLLGVEEGRAGEREELFAAWRTFFERVADRGVTILLFEDLQWADPGLLDFIDHVLEWSRSAADPDRDTGPTRPARAPAGLGCRPAQLGALSLEPLSDDVMSQGLDGLVPGLPDRAVTLDPGSCGRRSPLRGRDRQDAPPPGQARARRTVPTAPSATCRTSRFRSRSRP